MPRHVEDGGALKAELGNSVASQSDDSPYQYLNLLYGATSSTGFVEFRFLPSATSVFMPWPIAIDDPANFSLTKIPKGQQAYFGICLRRDASNGTKKNILPSHLLYVDFDLKGTGFIAAGKDVTQLSGEMLRAAAEQLLNEVKAQCQSKHLPPRLVVYTGHGLQVYWARQNATTIEDTEQFNRVLVGIFGKSLGADRKTIDAARIFRLPQTHNLKNPERPLKVEVWWADASAIVQDSDLALLAVPQPLQSSKSASRFSAPSVQQLIQQWNAQHPIEALLEQYGYKRDGDRFTRPGEGASGKDVVLLPNAKGVLCSFHHLSRVQK